MDQEKNDIQNINIIITSVKSSSDSLQTGISSSMLETCKRIIEFISSFIEVFLIPEKKQNKNMKQNANQLS